MELQLRTVERADVEGAVDVVVEGDTHAFFWLINAAGNARDGFKANIGEATDGTGNRLVLLPERALPDADQNWRSKTAHLRVGGGGTSPARDELERKKAELDPVELALAEAEVNALSAEALAALERRGVKVVVRDAGQQDRPPADGGAKPAGGGIQVHVSQHPDAPGAGPGGPATASAAAAAQQRRIAN